MHVYLKPDKDDLDKQVSEETNEEKPEDDFLNLDVSNYKSRVNILLLGVDTLTTEKDQRGTRSDTIMILSVDPVTKTSFMLSIPRDSYVKISGSNEYTKINHAHSYGGTDLAVATIKEAVNIPIHHYIKVDYNALFKTVDDLGGVEFDVPIDMYYVDRRATPPLNIDLKKGLQLLDGEKAMQLIRFRKGYGDQDLSRVKVQQDFLKAVLKKAYSPSSVTKIPKFIETLYDYVETDLTIPNTMALMRIGMNLDLDKIESAVVPGYPDSRPGAGSVIIIDEEAFREQLNYLLSGNYQQDEEIEEDTEVSTGSKTKTSAEINELNIAVLNGNGQVGAAASMSALLKEKGIEVDRTGNAASYDNEHTVIYYKDDHGVANQIKSLINLGSTKEGTSNILENQADIVILLGKDFN